ncbi:uncharacterized protein LOC115629471 [Scaptodrosophila lebanonensis]|uniref:Uncharacterized protein LOC115629471 n=1 Tax=Drosophila lebanonensis TaxID=7225 RepID=A0A6J2U3V0_DROLE|nr:uncharacterized protein LOC115629471 [Scaptodrosophila lebanonensis]
MAAGHGEECGGGGSVHGHGHIHSYMVQQSDNGDSAAVAALEAAITGPDALARSKNQLSEPMQASADMEAINCPYNINYQGSKPSPSLYQRAVNSKLNAAATAYIRPSSFQYSNHNYYGIATQQHAASAAAGNIGFGAGGGGTGGALNGSGNGVGLLPKPTYSAPAQFSMHLLPTPETHPFQLNVAAASFAPSQSLLAQAQAQAQRFVTKPQQSRWRRQPLPDLFHAVLGLMRELNRSVSYPEIINTLALRLQRPEVELKRHVPHTLHAAVNNGYLRKDGNRYTLLSEQEQVEIMKRNMEAAERAKELEKEPLSWRKR